MLCASPHTHPDPSFSSTCLAKAGGGPGGWGTGPSHPPASSVSFSAVFRKKQSIDTVSTYTLSTPARGRRTSPACGSCRRPRKIYENQGIENQKEKTTRPPYDKSEKIRKGGENEKDEARTARGTRERERTNINMSNEREAETLARRHKRHHFPPYSRAGGQIKEKSMIFEPPEPARPRFEPSKTHTFQWFSRAPARPRVPPRRKKGHPPERTRA